MLHVINPIPVTAAILGSSRVFEWIKMELGGSILVV